MDKKIIRFFPLFLILCLILDIVLSNITADSKGIWLYIIDFLSLIDIFAVTFVIFYIDHKKNESISSIIGLIGIALSFIVTVVSIILAKNIDVSNLSSLSKIANQSKTMRNISTILNQTISCLKYLSIINLISVNLNNSITNLSRKGAMLTNIIHHALQLYIILGEVSTKNFLYKASNYTFKVFEILMLTFIIYQFLSEEESHINDDVRDIQNTISKINNNTIGMNMSMNNNINTISINQPQMVPQTPPVANSSHEIKFRNPALEEQQRRLKEEERLRAMQQTPQINATYQQQVPNQVQTQIPNQVQNPVGINPVNYQGQPPIQNQNQVR